MGARERAGEACVVRRERLEVCEATATNGSG